MIQSFCLSFKKSKSGKKFRAEANASSLLKAAILFFVFFSHLTSRSLKQPISKNCSPGNGWKSLYNGVTTDRFICDSHSGASCLFLHFTPTLMYHASLLIHLFCRLIISNYYLIVSCSCHQNINSSHTRQRGKLRC